MSQKPSLLFKPNASTIRKLNGDNNSKENLEDFEKKKSTGGVKEPLRVKIHGVEYHSVREASMILGIDETNIRNRCGSASKNGYMYLREPKRGKKENKGKT